ncbi:MAG: heparinase II/III family protein, partial [Candidatus Latescibacteria bacterium]|nr:heparinase II/III family protein [Candidatus Latescibacterota bacterium]
MSLHIWNRARKYSVSLVAVYFSLIFLSTTVYAIEETHPFILYTPDSVDTIRERLDREPYTSWFATVIGVADQTLEDNIDWETTTISKTNRGYYAKMLAFAYAFGETSSVNHRLYGEEAAQVLYYIKDSNFNDNYSSDLEISECATLWAETYDMLKGAEFDFIVDGYTDMESSIRSKFKKLRDYMARDIDEMFSLSGILPSIQYDFPSVYYDLAHTDNHHVKLYGALTVLSLAIYGDSGSDDDYNRARSRFFDVLDIMTITGDNDEPVGGWAEGPYYENYSVRQYLSAFTALRNKDVLDFTTRTEIVQTHLLLPKLVMPDGYMPPIDDGDAFKFDTAGLLYSNQTGIAGNEMLSWMWNSSGKPINPLFLADYISQYNDTPPAYSNPIDMGWDPTEFFPESGFARFRNSWNSDAVYMLFLTEHGEARYNGQAHEHPDANSFILHAYGEMLLMDSGYGGFDYHDATRYAKNHNLILVNGQGPEEASRPSYSFWYANGADAYLTDYFTYDTIDYAMSKTAYRGADFKRSLLFPDHEYFIMYDTMSGDSEKIFTLLLHGNGGGTSGGTFAQYDQGAVWEHGNAAVRTYTVGSSDIVFDTEDMSHAVYSSEPMLTHTVLKVSASGSDERFLTVLFPSPKDSDMPEINPAVVTNGSGISISSGAKTDFTGMRLSESDLSIETGNGIYTSDGELLYVSVNSESDATNSFITGGTYIKHGEDMLVSAFIPANISLQHDPVSDISGFIQPSQESEVNIVVYAVKPEVVLFRGEEIPFENDSGNVSFNVSSEGVWKVVRAAEVIELEPPENVAVSDTGNDQGHSLTINWTASPSESEGLVEWYRIYRSQSDVIADILTISEFSSLEALIEWEEHNTVLVDSVTAGISLYKDNAVARNGVSYYYWIEAVGSDGASQKTAALYPTSVKEQPSPFSVSPPYPNPFNASVSLSYFLPAESSITILVYDVLGRKVRSL